MYRFILPLALIACASDMTLGSTREPEVIYETHTVTDIVTVFEEAPEDSEEIDPCDLEFRAYAEDGHYVDVAVGAMPLVLATTDSLELPVGSDLLGGVFEVSSKQGCGNVEILGVQVLIVRADGMDMTKIEVDNELIDLDYGTSEFTISGWYDASFSSLTAPTIGMDWGSEWTGPEIGEFAPYILGPNDSRKYMVRPNVLSEVPAGEYILTYSMLWRDPETGTEVWGANLDHAEWSLTLY